MLRSNGGRLGWQLRLGRGGDAGSPHWKFFAPFREAFGRPTNQWQYDAFAIKDDQTLERHKERVQHETDQKIRVERARAVISLFLIATIFGLALGFLYAVKVLGLTSQVTALTILGGLVSTGVGIWWGLRRGHHQGDQRDEDGPSS